MQSPASQASPAPERAIVANRHGKPCFMIKAQPPYSCSPALVTIEDVYADSPMSFWMSMTPEGARVMALQLQAAAAQADDLQAATEEQAALA